MIEHDPEFYRKWVAICQLSAARPLTMEVHGDVLRVTCLNRRVGEIPMFLFHRLNPREILSSLGVRTNDDIIQ